VGALEQFDVHAEVLASPSTTATRTGMRTSVAGRNVHRVLRPLCDRR
jgi:hypothetical protein